MLIYRLTCCIVILLALLSVLTVMAGSKCMAPVPKHFMTSSCNCLTFTKRGGSSKLTTERCDSNDENQWVQVTKIGKTEAVFHNLQNNRFICYDVCRSKFLLVDKEELEDDPEGIRLRRKLNRLLRNVEYLRNIVDILQEEERLKEEVKDVENFLQRDAIKENGLRKERGVDYRPKRRRRGRKKGTLRELKRKQRKLERTYGRIKTVKKLLHRDEDLALCQQEAQRIKSSTGGHQRRVRHCSKKPTRESLVCTLHEVMHGTGQNTIYAELYGGVKAIMKVKHGKIRSYRKPGSDQTPKGEFLVNSIGNDMC